MSEIGQKLINEVRMVAAKNPDFVYDEPEDAASCVYIHKGCPSCLVGQALWSLGLIDAKLESQRGPGTLAPNEDSVDNLLAWLELDLDVSEVEWLLRVQKRQDNEEPWGHCVGIS